MSALEKCQCCGIKRPNWKAKFEELNIYICSNCKSMTFDYGSKINFPQLYDRSYFFDGEYIAYSDEEFIHTKNFKRIWDIFSPYAPANLKIFEIGCAYGFFVKYALSRGVIEILGVDVSEDAIKIANNRIGDHFLCSEKFIKPEFHFNCLIALAVWEHMPEPFDYFSVAIDQLEKGGVIVITTPDSSSLVAKFRGEKWRQIHPPTHLHYPSFEGMKTGLRKLGVEVVYHKHYGTIRTLKTYLSAVKGFQIRNRAINNISFPLNLFDEQLIVGIKQ